MPSKLSSSYYLPPVLSSEVREGRQSANQDVTRWPLPTGVLRRLGPELGWPDLRSAGIQKVKNSFFFHKACLTWSVLNDTDEIACERQCWMPNHATSEYSSVLPTITQSCLMPHERVTFSSFCQTQFQHNVHVGSYLPTCNYPTEIHQISPHLLFCV